MTAKEFPPWWARWHKSPPMGLTDPALTPHRLALARRALPSLFEDRYALDADPLYQTLAAVLDEALR